VFKAGAWDSIDQGGPEIERMCGCSFNENLNLLIFHIKKQAFIF